MLGPASHEARTPLGAGAGISRIRLPVKPTRAVPPKGEVPPRQPLDLAEVLAKLAAVLAHAQSSEWIRTWQQRRRNTPMFSTAADQEGLNGHAQVQRILRTRHECPGVIKNGARDKSAGRSDDSAQGILELLTSSQRAPPSSSWSFPNSAKSHRDGRRSPRRGQNRRTRTAARDVVPDLWDTREEPPSNMHDGRALAAPITMKLNWTTMFSFRFSKGKHINVPELESLISLLRTITREGIRARRLVVLVDSRVVLGSVSKGRSSLRKINFLLRKLGFWCLAHDTALGFVGVSHLGESSGCPFTEQADRR